MTAVVLQDCLVEVVGVAFEEQGRRLVRPLEVSALPEGRDGVLEEEWYLRVRLVQVYLLGIVEGAKRDHAVLEFVRV